APHPRHLLRLAPGRECCRRRHRADGRRVREPVEDKLL
ncbi:MAG: hypothetical protein AVDCRST_MAG25-3650, partial [uncultured Rubrobacteraceae bacterium]